MVMGVGPALLFSAFLESNRKKILLSFQNFSHQKELLFDEWWSCTPPPHDMVHADKGNFPRCSKFICLHGDLDSNF